MAVEENVKENTPKAEGEAQGVKYISLQKQRNRMGPDAVFFMERYRSVV